MLHIAQRMTRYFIQKGIVPEEEWEIYEYGFSITIYTMVSTVGLLTIGMMMKRLEYTILILTIFSLSQTHGGGYHANSHLKCFLTMVISLVLALGISYIPIEFKLAAAAFVISIILLLAVPLTLHPNKAYLEIKASNMKRKSRLVTLITAGCALLGICVLKISIIPFALAFTMAAVSRIYAAWERRKNKEVHIY